MNGLMRCEVESNLGSRARFWPPHPIATRFSSAVCSGRPALASRGSIPQTWPPAQGAAHAAAPDSAQKTGSNVTPDIEQVQSEKKLYTLP